MPENVSPDRFRELDAQLQKQIKEIADLLHGEIKRLSDHPTESSGNAALYAQLKGLLIKVKENVTHHDYVKALDDSVEKLSKAEEQVKKKSANQEILIHLQAVNAELFRCRNVRG